MPLSHAMCVLWKAENNAGILPFLNVLLLVKITFIDEHTNEFGLLIFTISPALQYCTLFVTNTVPI